MKKIGLTMFVFVMVMTFGMGNSMARWGNFNKSGDNASVENSEMADDGQQKRHYSNRHHRRPMIHKLLRCIKGIGVSDETTEEIKTLLESYKTAQETQKENKKVAFSIYWDVLTATVLDEAALTEAEEAIIALKYDDSELKFDLALAIRNLLTDEELETLSECFNQSQEENSE